MSMSEMFARNANAPAGMPSSASAYVAAGKAQRVPSQVSGSGAAKAGNDENTFGFWSSKENKYRTIRLASFAAALALAEKMGWEYDEVKPEGWK